MRPCTRDPGQLRNHPHEGVRYRVRALPRVLSNDLIKSRLQLPKRFPRQPNPRLFTILNELRNPENAVIPRERDDVIIVTDLSVQVLEELLKLPVQAKEVVELFAAGDASTNSRLASSRGFAGSFRASLRSR